jgi:hypothetical protein
MVGIDRRHLASIAAIIAAAAGVLLWLGRPPICTCGFVKVWEGQVNGPGNSQHIADWYTFSHVTHGFVFYWLTWLAMRRSSLGRRAVAATLLEMAWEIVENLPVVIDRYRSATAAIGYSGDSVLNSVADGGWMLLGFLVAARLPWQGTLALALGFELFTLWAIRDNLTLNVIMLLWPVDIIRQWQAGP